MNYLGAGAVFRVKALKCVLTKHTNYDPFPTNIDFFVCEIERRRENRKIIH